MVVTNKKLISNVQCAFGEAGRKWIEELPNIIIKCIDKWDLEVVKEVKNLSYNYVLICNSKEYGEVLLKISPSEGEYNQEFRATSLINSPLVRRCYEYDKTFNALLLELINPGETLHSVESLEKKVMVCTSFIKSLPRKTDNLSILPIYKESLNKAINYVLENNLGGDELRSYAEKSLEFYSQLECEYESNYICHGDFHHENILSDQKRGWVVIDPKGFIGFWFGDIGRFVLNQLWKVPINEKKRSLERIIQISSKELGIPGEVIFMASFIETILCYCWWYQGEYNDEGYIKLKKDMMDDISPYIDFWI